MKDTNFTPGKWTVCEDAFGKYVVNESGDHVCEICGTAADARLMRERDEARAEVERLRAVVRDLCEVLDECVYNIDTRYGGPPGSNNIDRELIERAQAAMAKAKGET